jgi:phenylalanyl-tRNA synthetase alpha chain
MSQVLHPIEQKLLKTLIVQQNLTPEELCEISKLSIDQVRRGIEWLKFKNLANVVETEKNFVTLGKRGTEVHENGFPERQLVNHLRSLQGYSCEMNDVKNLLQNEFGPAIANAKKNGWVEIVENRIMLKGYHDVTSEEKIIKTVSKSTSGVSVDELDKDAVASLKKRPEFIIISLKKSATVSLTEKGMETAKTVPDEIDVMEETQSTQKNLTESISISDSVAVKIVRAIDVEATAPTVFVAKSHPLRDVIDEVREIFVSLGFSEIIGNNVQSSFWNFDALFTPQDHPAREMQDTFYLKDIKAKNIAKLDQIKKVSDAHKKGWNYQWQSEEARRLVLRTHTTCVTIRELADKKHDEARLFSIGRVFRNEKLSYKHLAEFHQVEGVVVGKNVTLRDLMGLQTEFYHKMGIKKIKFWPTFFPYTEPSLQSMIYNEKLGKWVELFGMGIFRPEVTKPLGIKNPVLAWGGGIERIAMLRYGLTDVRELYENKFGWLRSVPKCQ